MTVMIKTKHLESAGVALFFTICIIAWYGLHAAAWTHDREWLLILMFPDLAIAYILQARYHLLYWKAYAKPNDNWVRHPFYVLPWVVGDHLVFGRPPYERQYNKPPRFDAPSIWTDRRIG